MQSTPLAGPKIALHFPRPFVCVSTLITYTIIESYPLLPTLL